MILQRHEQQHHDLQSPASQRHRAKQHGAAATVVPMKKKKSKRNQRKRIEKHKYFVEFSHATENISKTSWKLIDYLRKYLDEWHYGSLVLKFQKSDAHRAAHRRQGVWKDEKLRFARDEQKSSTPTNVNDRWCIQINNVWHTRHERNTPSDSHLP